MGRINIRRQLPDIIHFQPIWGKVADKYGRKIIALRLRHGAGHCVHGLCYSSMASAGSAALNGTISGFNPAAISLVSGTTPKNRMGFAMGIMQSGQVAGTILGPLIGGLMASWVGFRPIFYITGGLILPLRCLPCSSSRKISTASRRPRRPSLRLCRAQGAEPHSAPALFAVTFLAIRHDQSHGALPLYVQKLHGTAVDIAIWAGFVVAVTGLSNMIASPILGKLSDKVGAHRILTYALIGTGLTLIPQAFVQSVWQLIIVRFMMGVFMGGLRQASTH